MVSPLNEENLSYLEYDLRTESKSSGSTRTLKKVDSEEDNHSTTYSILLIEDNPAESRLVKEYLDINRSQKFGLDLAENLEEALTYLDQKSYDALLLDLGLPDSDHLETFSEVQHRAPHTAIIILSGNHEEKLALQALELGAQDFIPKNTLNQELLKRSLFYAIQRQGLRQSLEEAQNKAEAGNKAKTEFLAMMSHELRTPLNAAVGGLQLIEKNEYIKDCTRYIELMHGGLNALISMIDQILDVTEIESNNIECENNDCSIEEIVSELAQEFHKSAKRKDISFQSNIEPTVPAHITTDAFRLNQVLNHLLSNAIKFTNKGTVSLTVAHDAPNSTIFTVSDSGVGIGAAFAKRIFAPFTQEDSSTTRRYGGAGLGLALSKNICQSMHWDLSFESYKGKGSTFTLKVNNITHTLAASPAKKYVPQHLTPESRKGLAQKLPLNILLAEDSVANQKVIRLMLQSIGYEIDIANDGYEAVQKADSQQYDLILMDIAMPNMDGHCAVNVIRYESLKNNTPNPYISALTATVSSSEKKKCFDSGMNAFLMKPAKLDQLVYVIEEAYALKTSH